MFSRNTVFTYVTLTGVTFTVSTNGALVAGAANMGKRLAQRILTGELARMARVARAVSTPRCRQRSDRGRSRKRWPVIRATRARPLRPSSQRWRSGTGSR
jgi:hypothetical protein